MKKVILDRKLSYDKIINIFLSLSKKYQEMFINNIINGQQDSKFKKNFMRYFKILENKVKNNEFLTPNEKTTFEIVYRYLIINNINIDKTLLHSYCTYYIKRNNGNDYLDKVYLIFYDLINCLNSELKKDYHIHFYKSKKDIAIAYMVFGDKDFTLHVNDYKLNFSCFNKKKYSYDVLRKIVIKYIFYIVHEYTHLLQKEYILKNNDSISEDYMKNVFAMNIAYKIYLKWHDYFRIEEEANIYAYSKLLDYYYLYFDKDANFDNNERGKYFPISLIKEKEKNKCKKLINYIYLLNKKGYDEYRKYFEDLKNKQNILIKK